MVWFTLSWSIACVIDADSRMFGASVREILIQWFNGSLVHWFIGMMIHRFIDSLVHWCSGSLFVGSYAHLFIGQTHMLNFDPLCSSMFDYA